MPKNTGMGGKNRKKGTNKNVGVKRELILREDGQEYGICTGMLGCNRIKVHLFSGLDVIGVIRGKIVRRMWINLGNVVLCGNREFQAGSQKVDIILRYTPDEATELQRQGQIPDISRWSVVGRGGMVEETEDGISGNIKFTKAGATNEVKPKASNEGWEMPSSSEEEDDEEDEEGEESSEGELEPDVEEIRKEDRHTGKVSRKQENAARARQGKEKGRGGDAAPTQGASNQRAAPQPRVVQQQRYVAPLEDDELDIDNI